MKNLWFCFVLVVLVGCVKKEVPTTGAIHGVVRDDETSQPLPGCSVMLMPTGMTTTTGSDGSFHFQDILPDTYSVEVSCYGYYTNKKSIIVGVGDASMSVDVLLMKYDPNNRLAELGALKVGSVTFNSARVECEIIDGGSSSVTERGFLYSETPDVTIATATKKIVKTTEDIFSATLNNLAEKTDYYVAAYAINGRGTAYSDVMTFTTGDASSVTAPSNVIYVSVSGKDSNDGSSWGKAKKTIQAAIDAATGDKQIWVSVGTYNEFVSLKSGVPVYGGFKGTETTTEVRTGKTKIRALRGDCDKRTVVDGFEFFSVSDGKISLEGNVVLKNCQLGNVSQYSGAEFSCHGKGNELVNCSILRCKEYDYGSYDDQLFYIAGELMMTDCFFQGNDLPLYVYDGNLTMYNCVVTNNRQGIMIENNTNRTSVDLYNCTVASNSTAFSGYGNLNLYNCLLWNNALDYKSVTTNSCIVVDNADNAKAKLKRPSSQAGTGATDWHTADWSIEAGSSCINAGVSLYMPSDIKTDLAGNDRISGNSIDVGAYEY